MAQFTNLVGCVLFVVAVGAKMEIFPEQGVITTKQWMADALRRGIEFLEANKKHHSPLHALHTGTLTTIDAVKNYHRIVETVELIVGEDISEGAALLTVVVFYMFTIWCMLALLRAIPWVLRGAFRTAAWVVMPGDE